MLSNFTLFWTIFVANFQFSKKFLASRFWFLVGPSASLLAKPMTMCAKLFTVPFKTEIRVKESTKLLFKRKIPFHFPYGHQRGGSNVMIQNNGCQRLQSIVSMMFPHTCSCGDSNRLVTSTVVKDKTKARAHYVLPFVAGLFRLMCYCYETWECLPQWDLIVDNIYGNLRKSVASHLQSSRQFDIWNVNHLNSHLFESLLNNSKKHRNTGKINSPHSYFYCLFSVWPYLKGNQSQCLSPSTPVIFFI